MILYFTGSGNSEYVANALADKLIDNVVSINNILKNELKKEFRSEKPFIIVSPIYAWRLPRIIENFIKEAIFKGSDKIYVVVTMGAQSGSADKYCKEIITNKRLTFMGFRGVCMPDNYVVYSKMPSSREVAEKLLKSRLGIEKIAKIISQGEILTKTDKTPLPNLLSNTVNNFFYKYMVTDKNYVVNDSCIGCGMCSEFCPVNNIEFIDSKPRFKGNCLNCYSCIHHCPTQAINIKNHTEKHGRYLCPPYKK